MKLHTILTITGLNVFSLIAIQERFFVTVFCLQIYCLYAMSVILALILCFPLIFLNVLRDLPKYNIKSILPNKSISKWDFSVVSILISQIA